MFILDIYGKKALETLFSSFNPPYKKSSLFMNSALTNTLAIPELEKVFTP